MSNFNNKNVGSISGTFFGRVRKSASARNKEFSITPKYLDEIYEAQGRKCIYSGVDIEILPKDFSTASVDRINSDLGYIEDNVQFVHKKVNVSKQEMTENRFLFLVSQIVSPQLLSFTYLEEVPEKRTNFRGFKTISGEALGHVRNRARKKNLEFDIDAEYLYQLLESQDNRCHYSGLTLFPKVYSKNGSFGNLSVDRINSDLGYVRGNIQLVLSEVNFMKHTLSDEDFIGWMNKIYNWVYVLQGHFKQIEDLTQKFYGEEQWVG